jgi:hypothetical protein
MGRGGNARLPAADHQGVGPLQHVQHPFQRVNSS